jgi:hypothetical protein
MSNANNGVGHSMSKGGSWLPSVKSGSETMGEGRRGLIGQLGRQAGFDLGRKEGGGRHDRGTGANKRPLGDS